MFVIYLVLLGEKDKNYTVLGAYTSFKAAEKFCLEYIANDDLAQALGVWKSQEETYWLCGADFLIIREIEVLE